MPNPAEHKTVGDDSCSTLKEEEIQCGCTCVYELLIAFSKFLTERHVHIRQQSESSGSFMSEPQPVHPTYIYEHKFKVAAEP